MICNKCNHKLPDDSEFCQYCGSKVEPIIEPPAEESTPSAAPAIPVAPTVIDLDGSSDPLKTLMEAQAKETIRVMEANRAAQPNNENDPEFGLVPEKPIFTLATEIVDGQRAYLGKLRTLNGDKITWKRLGSTSVEGINGMIDIYETFLPSGQPYKTIYINLYGAKKSTKAPAGFVLNNSTAQAKPAPKNGKTAKTKYCSRCGSVVDNKTKTCTGCGKQYFKGFRFTNFSITVIALALVIATVSILCVLQYVNTQELKDEISDLERQVSTKQSTINRLENEIDDLEDEKWDNWAKLNFFDTYAEIVPSDGTNTYHKWGCSKMDDDARFRIFNTAAVEDNYKKCPYCH